MIPYFEPMLHLWGTEIRPFGVMVGIGIALTMLIADREAKARCFYPKPFADMTTWGLVFGGIGAHVFEVVFYQPQDLVQNGVIELLQVWNGISSTGGVLGGLVGVLIFLRRRGLKFGPYSDIFALAVTPGWAIARIGCFLVHDHPGRLSHFFLAVKFPSGPRHDLGLEEAIFLFGISGVLFLCNWQGWLKGRLLALLGLVYGCGRFGLDFLRSTDLIDSDARYGGLTPAQYACIALVIWSVWKMIRPMEQATTETPMDAAGLPEANAS